MEKITVELTLQECMDVYRCIQKVTDGLLDECIKLQRLIDILDPTSEEYEEVKDEFEFYNGFLVHYKDLAKKFKHGVLLWI